MGTAISIMDSLSTKALECRDLGHAWTWTTDHGSVSDGNRIVGVERTLGCDRCDASRHETVSVTSGARSRCRYTYAPGYRVPGSGRIPADTVRLEYLRRTDGG